MQEITEYVDKGVTDPVRCYLSDRRVVAKYIYNDEGFISLFNELLGYGMADYFGIRHPNYGIAIYDSSITIVKNNATYINKTYFTYTELIEKSLPITSPKMLNKVPEEEIINLLLFDTFIYNTDRNQGNILISMPVRLYPIDYTHILPGKCVWNDELKNKEYSIDNILYDMFTYGYYQYLIENKTFTNELIDNCGKIFIDKVERLNEKDIINKIPKTIVSQISNEEYELLFEFFDYMKSNFSYAVEKLKKYIGEG
ncbi:hypothetical protein QOK74_12925 [Staphylococcus saprophyticus]|uniref:HipA family kinase n=1 Tax=Staphylococcus saprophyticus TaxID=29385 RepID=UPI001F54340D|nr:HipA family kinase [Staphylococcus saprophyticus]MDK1673739.1 hypothetical protein [Staphylococcus saprophyticus]